ncbi:MAG: hypothetical protein QOF78_1111 [Phycisphaerales bacterium]|jgi:hypothetical protein|nr:hypothetical protein [Phycisphaerales bacterium]
MNVALHDALTEALTLTSPALCAAATVLAVLAVVIAITRHVVLPRSAIFMMIVGLVCICLGAGGLTWNRRHAGHVAVVVDVSPSTASATFHDPQKLAARLKQLLGKTRYTLYQLSDGVSPAASSSLESLPLEVSCRATVYAPPPGADAVVLFSDARFATPPTTAPAPQTFVVADSALEQPPDTALERLEVRGGDTVVATLRNASAGTAQPPQLTLVGTDIKNAPVAAGRYVITGKITPGTREVTGWLRPGDPWMMNNSLSIRIPPRLVAQKWWIGSGPAPSAEWIRIDPADAPVDLADYLAPGVIVLDNVAADALPNVARARLRDYVRDLGGGIVILGGDHAYAAGGYAGTMLENLSPLASTPPKPAMQWLLLADSSGSMARTIGDNSRWHFAVNAIGQVIMRLPADDTLSVGNFSEGLRWWFAGKSVREAQSGFTSPKELRPHGPTNLAGALRLVADTADGAMPTQLLLVTDAEARIDNATSLADALASKQVHVSVLATENVPADNPLRIIADRTGGRIAGQSDPRKWAAELKQLMRAASPPWLGREPITVRFTDAGPRFAPQQVSLWNHAWLKRDATELAVGVAKSGERVPAVAAWNVGAGAVISAAFTPAGSIVEGLAERVATPPRDPRLRVTHDAARELRVTLDASSSESGYLNGLAPRLELSPDATRSSDAITMTQTAPGRYEIAIPAPPHPTFASVWLNGRLLDRFAVAGRYTPEFEAIGNDRPAMDSLARATGGAVIDPGNIAPLQFRWPTRPIALAPYLAAVGAAFVLVGLVRWRI